jgi:ATP-dependent protease Clp ATPase subunit
MGHYQKQNVLLLGPTGVGKTFLVRSIAKMIGVPFVKADATRFSEVGYMGANVDDIIRDLVQQAKGDLRLAENGIVYVDEVDKIAASPGRMGRDVSGRGVQFGFLRLLEDADVDINSSHDIASQFRTFMNLQKKGGLTKEVVRTKNILFIFSGAFPDLVPIIKKRLSDSQIGINTKVRRPRAVWIRARIHRPLASGHVLFVVDGGRTLPDPQRISSLHHSSVRSQLSPLRNQTQIFRRSPANACHPSAQAKHRCPGPRESLRKPAP